MPTPINPQDLIIHILNVGFGDNILIELPEDGLHQRSYGLVDCQDAAKTKGYLEKLRGLRPGRTHLAFLCATHPHQDHVGGIEPFLKDSDYRPHEFWDSGFCHNSRTYMRILETLCIEGIEVIRVSSGMEWYFGKIQITALAPSVALRNRFATYGVDMNNASIVLRLQHHAEAFSLMHSNEISGAGDREEERSTSRAVVILAGDAEFESWAQIAYEYPHLERTSENDPQVKKMINYLACSVVKVAHHGSMHSAALNIYETMSPSLAIVSTRQMESTKNLDGLELRRYMFPHQSTTIALEECGTRIVTTDGSYESRPIEGGEPKDAAMAHPGSIIVVVPPGGKPRWTKLKDQAGDIPEPPCEV